MTDNVTSAGIDEDVVWVWKNLFEVSYPIAVSYVTTLFVLSTTGIIGNCLIIYVKLKTKGESGHANAFIVNLAIGDLCVTAIAEPLCIIGAFQGPNLKPSGLLPCSLIASMCLFVCVCAFMTLLALTVNRWLFICHKNIYMIIFNKTSSVIICASCWIIGVLSDMPNYVGWGGYRFDFKSFQCMWNRTASRSYTLFLGIGFIVAPFILLAFCNVAILRKIWRVKHDIVAMNALPMGRNFRTITSSAKTLIVMLVTFLILWTPYALTLILDYDDKFSMTTHMLANLLAHAHSSTPCIIYICMQGKFREHVSHLWRRNSVHPTG